MKDWTGNNKSVYTILGASNHSKGERQENDYYATDPKSVEKLLEVEQFNHYIWEPACGEGHISKVLEAHGYEVESTDLIYRGYGEKESCDFLLEDYEFDGDIITNPPYKYAQEFVEKALKVIPDGNRVAMFLKIQFLEGKKRREMFDKFPPEYIYIQRESKLCQKR